jgi:YkoY family integral membrane protein
MLEPFTHFADATFSIDTIGILFALVALETMLSADNAVALAAIVQPLPEPSQQKQALNWGLVAAFVLRIGLLFAATWVIQFWQFELLGAIYLLWLTVKYFWTRLFANQEIDGQVQNDTKPTCSLWHVVSLIAFTDLAFSLDSVTTAVAIADETWLVLTGCIIGIITLRFLAGLFVRWLEEFIYLQDAAYLTVLGVALRLMCKALQPNCVPPDWMVLAMVAVLFAWGFSKRAVPEIQAE